MTRVLRPLVPALLPFALGAVHARPMDAQNRTRNVEGYVASQMTAQHIPAISFAVVQNGALVQSGARGLANVELKAPAADSTEFAIASMSKSITASAVMLLAQDGRLSIDDRVGHYLTGTPAAWDAMTIRDLLAHTSGVKDHFSDSPKYPTLTTLDRHLTYSTDEYVKAHIDAPLNFAPGTDWAYSGGGYVILGAIIAKITGRPYGEFLRDRIFEPLGMAHTHVVNGAEIVPNRASGYWFRDGVLLNGDFLGPAHAGGADVGVLTTARDLAAWLIAVESARLWTPASRDAMWTAATLRDGRDTTTFPGALGYGLGWGLGTYRGYHMAVHPGTLRTGFTSAFFMLPEKRLGVIVLTNQYDANPQAIAMGIASRYDADLTPPSDRRVERDDDPAESGRAQAFVDAIFRGGDVSSLTTQGLARHMATMWHPPGRESTPSIVFIAREPVTRPLRRFDAGVTRLAHYKVRADGEMDRWITLLLTADGRIAGYEAY
jgi:D-alanyl-D-alanine carboxypeptidase